MKNMKTALFCALGVIIADQISKAAVLYYFSNGGHTVEVAPFFNIVLAWNKGVSFSLFHPQALAPWVLTLVALLICAVILHWISMENDPKTRNCFGLILGGALGNVIDRVIHGAVVDFLDFHVGIHHWPAFNIADSAICVGAFFILFWNIFILSPDTAPASKKENKNDSNP